MSTPLHLFNKVYIEHTDYIDSTLWGALIYDGVDKTDLAFTELWLGDDLADALGDDTFLEKMTELAALDTKYVIYADTATYTAIVAAWLKSTTHMDQAAFDYWVDIYSAKRDKFSVGSDSLKTALKAAWAGATQHDLSTLSVSYSIEWMLPSVWGNASHSCAATAKSVVNDFVKRRYEDAFTEAKWFIDQNILKASIQTLMGGSGKTIDNYHDLPKLTVFKESFWTQTGLRAAGANGKIDLTAATADNLTALKLAYTTMFGQDGLEADIFDDFVYLTAVSTTGITDANFATILNTIKTTVAYIPYVPEDLEETITVEFLGYIQELALNDTATLAKYALR
jgi:hypothetical protein